ncbi:Thymus-specific serine protease [Tulasnella sp. 427]|nr:Thymus-specific serine protease [Tulasnella sp. 427]
MTNTLSVVGANGFDFEYWFNQLIDHNNPAAGTFKQRYFFSDQFWTGDGAPIVLQTSGAANADGWWTQLQSGSLQSKIMGELGAAGVFLEHRYWGKSSPVPDLTNSNLQWLTVEQGVEDLKHSHLFTVLCGKRSAPPQCFINTPGSDAMAKHRMRLQSSSGILVAYCQEKHSDVFASAYASSAPVQADEDFWEYWQPVEQGMPLNCSLDLKAAIASIDDTLMDGTSHQIEQLKESFGLDSLQDDDFGRALTYPLTTWQQLQAYDFQQAGRSLFFKFCDAIETGSDGTINQSSEGVGMPQALTNWAAFYKALRPDTDCPNTGGACYSSYNYSDPFYADTSLSNPLRAWEWLRCSQLGFFETGSNTGIISRSVTLESQRRQCSQLFPPPSATSWTNSSAVNTTTAVDALNAQYGGWNMVGTNLFVTNGEFDPTRPASLSSRSAPAFADSPTQEIVLIPNAHQCWDWSLANAAVNIDVMRTQELGIATIRGWLNQWYAAHPTVNNTMPPAPLDPNSLSAIASLKSQISSMQDEITKMQSRNHGAIASYVLNGVFSLALLVAFGYLIRERYLRSQNSQPIRAVRIMEVEVKPDIFTSGT